MAQKQNNLFSVQIGDSPYIKSQLVVCDRSSGSGLAFISVIGRSAAVKDFTNDINRAGQNLRCYPCGYYNTVSKGYDVYMSKDGNSQYSHAIVCRKDKVEKLMNGDESATMYLFLKEDFDGSYDCKSGKKDMVSLYKVLFSKLYKNMSVPLLEEWMPYIFDKFVSNGMCFFYTTYRLNDEPFSCIRIQVNSSHLYTLVQEGLKNSKIFIRPGAGTSEVMRNITGLDSYLGSFQDTLAKRIQTSFTPEFTPGVDAHDERLNMICGWAEYQGLNPYPAQRDVVQAIANKLSHDDVVLLKGEMGTGKTVCGSFASFMVNRKPGSVSIVMAPAYLKSKWELEIKSYVPFSEVVMIESLGQLQSLEAKIKNPKRKGHLFLVMSNEIAKMNYTERPCAVHGMKAETHPNMNPNTRHDRPLMLRKGREVYRCPDCGQVLTKTVKTSRNRYEEVPLDDEDFTSLKKGISDYCTNKVQVWDNKAGVYFERKCGTKLWTVYNRNDMTHDWVKIKDDVGWVRRSSIGEAVDALISKEKLTEKESTALAALSDAQSSLEEGTFSIRAPRQYCVSKYIRKNLSGHIDFFIADEIHKFAAEDSAQGRAFGDLLRAAKKSILLTGTLLYGRASSIFYILFRAFPRMMVKSGYSYKDCDLFWNTYGVSRTTATRAVNANGAIRDTGRSKKELPGISPLVFTKFLLEHAVFLNMRDISEGLPGYSEHPVPIAMSSDMQTVYDEIYIQLRETMSTYRFTKKGSNVMTQAVNTMLIWPDSPIDNPPIKNEAGDVVFEVPSFPDLERNKDQELMDLIDRKVAEGEHVLVFYHWTNRTNLGKHIVDLAKSHGHKSIELRGKGSSVKAEDRPEWIEKQVKNGLKVLVCNPTLVETGLDLLDFTTIIWYQVGFNLNTLRQASRRSWRLNQTKNVEVYFLYYTGCPQQDVMSLMATKLQAAMAIEGEFSEEGLSAMSNNEDVLQQLASSVVEGISMDVDTTIFTKISANEAREGGAELRAKAAARQKAVPLRGVNVPVNKKRISAAKAAPENTFIRRLKQGENFWDIA